MSDPVLEEVRNFYDANHEGLERARGARRYYDGRLERVLAARIPTKALYREDYERIAATRAYFGAFDPFGNFDLLFGAARLNLRIVDLAIRCHERRYGETKISRFRHGALLLRMRLFAARKLKFL